jgi:hypothetical protein
MQYWRGVIMMAPAVFLCVKEEKLAAHRERKIAEKHSFIVKTLFDEGIT